MGDTDWMHEKIPYIPKGNWLYRVVCFLMGRRKKKLSYQEMYMLLKEINRKSLGEEKSKKKSMEKIMEYYKFFHNNKLPDIVNDYDE